MVVLARLFLGLVMVVGGAVALLPPGAAQQSDCDAYTSTATAQFALEETPGLAPALDPDGNGIACDHQDTGDTAPPAGGLQLPGTSAETPASQVPAGATIDVIDQQPADTTTTTTAPAAPTLTTTPHLGVLDGRLGGSRSAFEVTHGAPIATNPSETVPAVVLRAYTPPPAAANLYTVDVNDQVAVVGLTAESSWDTRQAATIISPYLPGDVTELPTPELLADGTQLITVFSADLASGVTAEAMARAGIPGVPGDLYLLLSPDNAGGIVEMEIGLGNGDDLRDGLQPSV